MSNNTITGTLPVGDIQFYDNYVPPLEAGLYTITANQTVSKATAALTPFTQDFIVAAPQYSIDTAQIINMFPPQGSTSKYAGVLPHIVLKDPMLPWERSMPAVTNPDFKYQVPWMAIMVFQEEELEAITGASATGAKTTTIKTLRSLNSASLFVPQPTLEADLTGKEPCQYIQMKASTFQANVATVNELPFTAHVRQVNTGGRAELGINETGLFSVMMSNRLASTPANVAGKAGQSLKNTVHLVSLEGVWDNTTGSSLLGAQTDIALVSLASWTFNCLPEQSQDFAALALNLAGQKLVTDPPISPDKLLFRLTAPTGPANPALTTITKRINDGYMPLAYHTRSAEDTMAWYRGPFSPVLPAITTPTPTFLTSDAAMIYNDSTGLFDVSLASAWEAGREAALSDGSFGPMLLDFRRKALSLLDELIYKLQSDGFSSTTIATLNTTANISTAQEDFLSFLTPELLSDIGINDTPYKPPVTPTPVAPSTTNVSTDAESFYTDPAIQKYLEAIIKDDLAPIAEWLAKLMLLYPIPFDNLVPNEELLPNESIRFFYIDQNWLNAAVDGAMSLGMESSQLVVFHKATKGMILKATQQALAIMRDKAEDITTDTTFTPPTKMSGFLLRSGIVTGWPNLVVKANSAHTNDEFHILRMTHLSSSVLLVIFDGIPESIELSQPAESLEFGLEENGNNGQVKPRSLVSTGVGLAEPTTGPFITVKDNTGANQDLMRSATSNVLNIAPTTTADSNSLIYELTQSLITQKGIPTGTNLSPATFAVQMVKAPESITFLTSV